MLKYKPSRVICEVRACGSTCCARISLSPFGFVQRQQRRGCGGAALAPAFGVRRKSKSRDLCPSVPAQGTPPIPGSVEVPCR